MLSENKRAGAILAAIEKLELPDVRLMEVCGTHTMAIAKSGIKAMLPASVRLLSGPGCPVCVTTPELIDSVLDLAEEKNVIISTYGDMLRVPGSRPGDSLQRRRALGARVEMVYSPIDAIELAKQNPDKQVVFLGVGFETTAPGTAAAVLTAKEQGVKNFTLWSMLKTVEPALRALMKTPDFNVQGFICPGHVATIIGERGFRYLPEEFSMPAVIAGFEPDNILAAIYKLLVQISEKRPRLENGYRAAVSENGNELAQKMIEACFVGSTDSWRGLGEIEGSGHALKEELWDFDAKRRFKIPACKPAAQTACRCGEVITGRMEPEACPMFGARCTPEDPVGPCMVSTEGACAAAFKYQRA